MSTVYGTIRSFPSVRAAIFAARGFTMAATTRKLPNCLNLLRQAEVLQVAGFGSAEAQFQDRCVLEVVVPAVCFPAFFNDSTNNLNIKIY